jgi:rod shape-determining protein MreC
MAISHRRPRNARLLVVALLLASLTTITADARGGEDGPLAAIGRVGVAMVTPLQEAASTVFRPVTGFFSNLFRAGSIKAENDQLRGQLEELRGQIVQQQGIVRENQEFRRQFNISKRLELDTFEARVIGNGISNFEWAVFIDKGSNDGVRLDMPVMTRGALVGRVVKLTPTSAKVMLIIDPDSAVASRLSVSREIGLVEGRRNQDLRFGLAAPDTEVQPGEVVETSGYDRGLFPPDIPIGEVSSATPDLSGLQPEILVRPYVDFSRLDHVFLVRGSTADAVDRLAEEEESG